MIMKNWRKTIVLNFSFTTKYWRTWTWTGGFQMITQHEYCFLVFSLGMRMCSISECLGDITRECSILISLDAPFELLGLGLDVCTVSSTISCFGSSSCFEFSFSWWTDSFLRFPDLTASTTSLAYSLRPTSLNGFSSLTLSSWTWKKCFLIF